jgi:hypothetical protein
MEAKYKGQAHVGVRKSLQKMRRWVSDEEFVARLLYYGVTLLHRPEIAVWLMPLGHLLDQWEVHKQYHGLSKPKREITIDDIMPY